VIWPQIRDIENDLLQQFRQLGVPFVVCDQDLGSFDFVGVDNEEGARLGVEHLREQGHCNIVYLTRALRIPSLVRRRDGYRAACLACKMRHAAEQIMEIPDYSVEQCAVAFAEMRRKYPAATAFMGSNDLLVLRVLDAAKAAGLRVPEDLSAVGFDDIDAAAQAVPALTTVRQNFYEIGVLAAQLLFRRLNQKGHSLQEQAIRIKLEPSLIQRASTAQFCAAQAVNSELIQAG
jgi:DNA-binding LacI/PurR family transcriptional regulator